MYLVYTVLASAQNIVRRAGIGTPSLRPGFPQGKFQGAERGVRISTMNFPKRSVGPSSWCWWARRTEWRRNFIFGFVLEIESLFTNAVQVNYMTRKSLNYSTISGNNRQWSLLRIMAACCSSFLESCEPLVSLRSHKVDRHGNVPNNLVYTYIHGVETFLNYTWGYNLTMVQV